MSGVWFESWERMGALAVALVAAYCWLLIVLRLSGKRTLAKLSAFDFVVTIALGSTFATVIASREVPIAEGALALVGLVGAQYVAARSTQRWHRFERLVKPRPTALLVDGRLRHDAMRRNRVSSDEVAAAVRKAGIASLHEVVYVVLETDGTFSVLCRADDDSALAGVEGVDDVRGSD